jgi:alpha-L-fucosidase
VSIRPGWFYHVKEDSLVKSPEKLFDIYLKSVGRGANLILNVPPDPRGLITPFDSAALMGFAKLRQESFGNSLLQQKHRTVLFNGTLELHSSGELKDVMFPPGGEYKKQWLQISFDDEQIVNCIRLNERIQNGQQIKSFSIKLYDKNFKLVYNNKYTTIGHQRILSFPAKKIKYIEVRILDAKRRPVISKIDVFHIPEKLVEQ